MGEEQVRTTAGVKVVVLLRGGREVEGRCFGGLQWRQVCRMQTLTVSQHHRHDTTL